MIDNDTLHKPYSMTNQTIKSKWLAINQKRILKNTYFCSPNKGFPQ